MWNGKMVDYYIKKYVEEDKNNAKKEQIGEKT